MRDQLIECDEAGAGISEVINPNAPGMNEYDGSGTQYGNGGQTAYGGG